MKIADLTKAALKDYTFNSRHVWLCIYGCTVLIAIISIIKYRTRRLHTN